MNTSFDPLDLVNTYGAFGSVSTERLNVVFEGTMDEKPNSSANWQPYVCQGTNGIDRPKPGTGGAFINCGSTGKMVVCGHVGARRIPRRIAYRPNFRKLLNGDRDAISLFTSDPFLGKQPRYIRAVLYRYSFAKPGNTEGQWWKRQRLNDWLAPVSLNDTGPKRKLLLKMDGSNCYFEIMITR